MSTLKGQTDIADLLIAKGANVGARDKAVVTPLHQAAWKGNRVETRRCTQECVQGEGGFFDPVEVSGAKTGGGRPVP